MGLIGNYLKLMSMSREIEEKTDVKATLSDAQARMNAVNAQLKAQNEWVAQQQAAASSNR
jgi:hypothetical protein